MAQCGNDARALGVLGLDLLQRYSQLSRGLAAALPTDNLINGGDLETAVRDAVGLTTVFDVLMGLAEAIEDETASMPTEGNLERCREHALDYVREIGDPVVLTLEEVRTLQSPPGDLEGRLHRIERSQNDFAMALRMTGAGLLASGGDQRGQE